MGTDNEFGLRHIEFEGLGGCPINSELLAARNSGLGLRREVRARDIDLGVFGAGRGELQLGELRSWKEGGAGFTCPPPTVERGGVGGSQREPD